MYRKKREEQDLLQVLDVGCKPRSVCEPVCHDLLDFRVMKDLSASLCGIPCISPFDL